MTTGQTRFKKKKTNPKTFQLLINSPCIAFRQKLSYYLAETDTGDQITK